MAAAAGSDIASLVVTAFIVIVVLAIITFGRQGPEGVGESSHADPRALQRSQGPRV